MLVLAAGESVYATTAHVYFLQNTPQSCLRTHATLWRQHEYGETDQERGNMARSQVEMSACVADPGRQIWKKEIIGVRRHGAGLSSSHKEDRRDKAHPAYPV